MSNSLYNTAKEGFLSGEISWRDDNIKVVLIDTDEYTPNISTDKFLTDIPQNAKISTSGNLQNKTITDGIADADDVTFPTVTGNEIESAVIYQDTGLASTSRLIAYLDVGSGIPITPSGSDITIVWNSGATKIFQL